jgi:hypothetical protein
MQARAGSTLDHAAPLEPALACKSACAAYSGLATEVFPQFGRSDNRRDETAAFPRIASDCENELRDLERTG